MADSVSEPPELEEEREGGDPACWAGIVCQECGAVISEGHLAGCSQSCTDS